jgi:hypothetical protein
VRLSWTCWRASARSWRKLQEDGISDSVLATIGKASGPQPTGHAREVGPADIPDRSKHRAVGRQLRREPITQLRGSANRAQAGNLPQGAVIINFWLNR